MHPLDAACDAFERSQLATPIDQQKLDRFLEGTRAVDLPDAERLRRLAIHLEHASLAAGWADLLTIYRRAVTCDPSDPNVRLSAGIAADQWQSITSDPTERLAIEADVRPLLEPALDMAPTDPAPAFVLGLVAYGNGQHDGAKALELFREAQRRDQDDVMSVLYEGHCLHDLGLWQEALGAYGRVDQQRLAAEVAPWRALKLREQIAHCLAKDGQRRAALDAARAVLAEIDVLLETGEPSGDLDIVSLDELVDLACHELRHELYEPVRSTVGRLGWEDHHPELFGRSTPSPTAAVGAHNMPAAEVDIDEGLVRALLDEQHPDLAGLAIAPLAFGWDNVIYRLGDELTVRLPRRELAAALVAHEQRWLPELAPHLPLRTPVPVRIGRPSPRFAWPWTVGPYLPGAMAAEVPPDDPLEAATALGGFVAALARPAPPEAPHNPYRGVPLIERDEAMRVRIEQLAGHVDGRLVTARWEAALAIEPYAGPPRWLHGDLHPANVLVEHGRISAVIDFGDITAGDPATDLAAAWMFFGADERAVLREAASAHDGIDHAMWGRARGWALLHGVLCLASSADNPVIRSVGQRTLTNVLADHDR